MLVREAPADDVRDLQKLAGHLTEGWFITKFRKLFCRDEMNDDLLIVAGEAKTLARPLADEPPRRGAGAVR